MAIIVPGGRASGTPGIALQITALPEGRSSAMIVPIVQPTTSYEMDAVMDFAFSETQKHWYDAALRFAREELVDPEAASREKRSEFWREGYERCARFGLLGLPVPAEYGGQGQDLATTVAAIEGLGHGCADTGLIFGTGASIWTVTMPMLAFGTEAQKRRYLPGLCDGRLLGANAASEPGAGSDIFGMETRAVRHGDGWVLNGRKTWITSGAIADLVVCFASTDPTKGVLGITAFLVERDTPGFQVVRPIENLGLRTAPMAEMVFENCVLPAESILGREGRGSTIFNAALEWERGAILAGIVGTMRRQLDRCVEHARSQKAVRPADRQVSVGLESDRRHDHPAGNQPVHGLSLRLGQVARQGRRALGVDGQAPCVGELCPEQPGRGSPLWCLGLCCR